MKRDKKNRKLWTWIFVVLGILCILYGVRVFFTGYGTLFFLVWVFMGLIMGGVALAIHKRLWERLPKWLKCGIITVFSIGLMFFIFVQGLILSQVNAKGQPDLDYVIILGALVREDGPSQIMKARLDAAIEYLEENPDTKIICSGGQGYNEPFSEAEGMRRYLEENGIDPLKIILEDQSTNTIENITNSMEFINEEDAKVGIATSNFHTYRAVKIARKQGLDACGISGNVIVLYMPSNMFREFFGIVKDTLKGNM